MKGPGLRVTLDVRRVWRCPRCGRIARTSGDVTSQRCRCAGDGCWMELQLPEKREPFVPPHREPLPETEETELAPETPASVEVVETVAAVVIEETVVELIPSDAAEPASGDFEPASPGAATPESNRVPEAPPDEFGAGLAEGPGST